MFLYDNPQTREAIEQELDLFKFDPAGEEAWHHGFYAHKHGDTTYISGPTCGRCGATQPVLNSFNLCDDCWKECGS